MPLGTIVYRLGINVDPDDDQEITLDAESIHELILTDRVQCTLQTELLHTDDMYIAARGGQGGKGEKSVFVNEKCLPYRQSLLHERSQHHATRGGDRRRWRIVLLRT